MRFKIITGIILLLNVVCLLGDNNREIRLDEGRKIVSVQATDHYSAVISKNLDGRGTQVTVYKSSGENMYDHNICS